MTSKPPFDPKKDTSRSGQHPAVQEFRRKLESIAEGTLTVADKLDHDLQNFLCDLKTTPPPEGSTMSDEKEPAHAPAIDVSVHGLSFISKWEGLRLKMYNDASANCTIGYGHLIHKGATGKDPAKEAPFVNGITQEQAVTLLHTDAQAQIAGLKKHLHVPLTQQQVDALVCLSFNIGPNALATSTILRLVNEGVTDADQIRNAFKLFNKRRGPTGDLIHDQGLENRRLSEARVFLEGKY